jgi:hypothetical protein
VVDQLLEGGEAADHVVDVQFSFSHVYNYGNTRAANVRGSHSWQSFRRDEKTLATFTPGKRRPHHRRTDGDNGEGRRPLCKDAMRHTGHVYGVRAPREERAVEAGPVLVWAGCADLLW